jgi:membrane protein DedA with SNARE-associated domain
MHPVPLTFDLFSLETIQALAQDYGYWAIFFGIMLENMGLPLPGETVTLVGGFLAGSEELTYRWVLSSAIAGADIGDSIG